MLRGRLRLGRITPGRTPSGKSSRLTEPVEPTPSVLASVSNWLPWLLPWVGGANIRALRKARSDRPFFTALGAWTLGVTVLSAITFTFAIAYVARKPASELWAIGLVWFAFLLAFERLLLVVEASSVWGLIFNSVLRIAIAVGVALLVGQFTAMRLYEPEIQAQMLNNRAAAMQDLTADNKRTFDDPIDVEKAKKARLIANESKVKDREALMQLRSRQASELAGFCDSRCEYYAVRAQDARDKLSDMRDRNAGRIAGIGRKITDLTDKRRTANDERVKAIDRQDGLAARRKALDQVEKENSSVAFVALLLKLVLGAFEVVAILVKLGRVAFVKNGAYELILEGQRDKDGDVGVLHREESKTNRAWYRDKATAQRRANRTRANTSGLFDDADLGDASVDSWAGEPIDTPSLTEFTDEMESWERRDVDVPGPLRRGALIGLVALAVTLLVVATTPLSGALIVVPFLAAGVLLGVTTRGFARAPAWALQASFALLLIGLAAPVLVFITNT